MHHPRTSTISDERAPPVTTAAGSLAIRFLILCVGFLTYLLICLLDLLRFRLSLKEKNRAEG
jgi:hypothetical protein